MKNLEKKVDLLRKKCYRIGKRIEELELIPEVKEYIALLEKQEEAADEYGEAFKKLVARNQEECKHPLWYQNSSYTDSHEIRTYLNCTCVNCFKDIEERPRDIKGSIINVKKDGVTFKQVREIYLNLLNSKKIDSEVPIDETIKKLVLEK